jgi:hypothetical protein
LPQQQKKLPDKKNQMMSQCSNHSILTPSICHSPTEEPNDEAKLSPAMISLVMLPLFKMATEERN